MLALRHALAPDGREQELARAAIVRFEQTRLPRDRVVDTGGFTESAALAVFKVGRTAGPASDPAVRQQSREGGRSQVDGCFRTALAGVYAGGESVAPLEQAHAPRHASRRPRRSTPISRPESSRRIDVCVTLARIDSTGAHRDTPDFHP